jgi:hypothetical protein
MHENIQQDAPKAPTLAGDCRCTMLARMVPAAMAAAGTASSERQARIAWFSASLNPGRAAACLADLAAGDAACAEAAMARRWS